MINDKMCKFYMLTIANPIDRKMEHDNLKDILADFNNIDYWCMCDHISQDIYHTHLFIAFSKPVRFTRMIKRFPVAHIDEVHGTLRGNRSYIRSEGFYKNMVKGEKVLLETFEEFKDIQ